MDARLNLAHLDIDKLQDVRTWICPAIPEGQHLLDLLEGDAESLGAPNEL
jgi:hypothetical protein